MIDTRPTGQSMWADNLDARRRKGAIFRWTLIAATVLGVVVLAVLLIQIVSQTFGWVAVDRRGRVQESWSLFEGLLTPDAVDREWSTNEDLEDTRLEFRSWINWTFIQNDPSRRAEQAGVRTAILGSIWLVGLTALFAFPIGVGAAIYLEEYADHRRWYNRLIQTNIANLAGVPSIIYGLLGLAIFVRYLEPITQGRTLLSGALTMALLVLPLIIIPSQEAIRAVPRSLRQASLGLGATKWQTIRHHVLPSAFPGILTSTIIALSRAIGETAPLIVVGAFSFIAFNPTGPLSRFTALPIQIFGWTALPQAEFQHVAAAGIVVLLVVLLTLNSIALFLRNRFYKRI